MATTFGNTLTELQAGINAAQALDYQRANAQDEANTRRAVARIQQRGQESDTAARRQQQEAQNTIALVQLLAKQRESAADRQSLMDRERFRGQTDLDIAKMQLERSAFDPRALTAIAETETLNNEKIQKFEQAKRLSAARKQWVGRLGAERAKGSMFVSGSPDKNAIAEAEAAIKSIEAQAAALEIGLVPDSSGGFTITPPTLIPTPAMLNPRGTVALGPTAVNPAVIPVVPPPAAAPSWLVDPSTIPAGNPNPIPPPIFAVPESPLSQIRKWKQTPIGWMPVN